MSLTETLPEVSRFLNSRESSQRVWTETAEVSQELVAMAEAIAKLTGTWNPVEIFTPDPTNLAQEKARFFEAFSKPGAKEYVPQFKYPVAERTEVFGARKSLNELLKFIRYYSPQSEKDRLFRVALYAKVRDDLATCDLVDGINTKSETQIQAALLKKYPPADPTLIAYAERIYQDLIIPKTVSSQESVTPLLSEAQQTLLKNTPMDAHDLKSAFEWVLRQYGILRDASHSEGFQVVISDAATGIDVRDKSEQPMTIFIPSTRKVTADKLLELVAHEIEGHARQSMNGLVLFRIGGGPLKMDGEVLYEGLAKRLDESFRRRFFGEESGVPGPWYTIAIDLASKGASFFKIFSDQYLRQLRVMLRVPGTDALIVNAVEHEQEISKAQNAAWTTTYRVMRGHVDMRNPLGFAMNKDLAYLQGWLMDKQLQEAGLGGINEMAVIQSGGLQLFSRLDITDAYIPFLYRDLTKAYCFDVLLPRLMRQSS